MLLEQGFPKDFIQPLLKKVCDPTLFAEIYSCTWDATYLTLTTKKDSELNEKMKAYENASWFKNKLGLLRKAICKKDYVAHEALYNLDGGELLKSVHDRHHPTAADAKADSTKKVGFADMVKVKSKDKARNSASHASTTSALSGLSEERLLPKDPSGGHNASASLTEEMDASGATSGG
jgi:hypothetical protein